MKEIRGMNTMDFQAVREVLAPYFNAAELNVRMEKIKDALENKLENPVTYRVATINDKAEGLMGFRKPPEYLLPFTKSENPVELYMLFVRERIKGIGRMLVRDMEDIVRSKGFSEVVVFSALRRKDGWGFYEAVGYLDAGTLDRRGGEGQVFTKAL